MPPQGSSPCIFSCNSRILAGVAFRITLGYTPDSADNTQESLEIMNCQQCRRGASIGLPKVCSLEVRRVDLRGGQRDLVEIHRGSDDSRDHQEIREEGD